VRGHHGHSTRANRLRQRSKPAPACDDLGKSLCTSGGRTVDDSANSGDSRKLSGITLGIRKYPLTWDYASANVSPVPGSARQPGPKDRVFGATPSGRATRKTTSAHEAEATPDGARSHAPKRRAPGFPERRAEGQLRCTGTSVRRRLRTAKHGPKVTGAPQLLSRSQDRGAIGDGTGNRVSVNGARPLGRATGPESNSGNGGSGQTDPDRVGGHRRRATGGGADRSRTGQPETGPTTGIARRAFGHDGRCVRSR
jgi:hypothetical protein